MPIFDNLERASFDGLEFPVKGVRVRGRYRHHTHEYLRVPGGVNEKLERGLYTIEMDAVFDTNVRGYGELWPTVLAAIRSKYERGITSTLVIPTIGGIQAFIPDWDQSADMGKKRSGEEVRLQFLEDDTQQHLTAALVKVQQSSLASSAENFSVTRAAFAVSESDASLFDKIQDKANSILAFKDRADLYGGLMAARIGQLTNLLAEADRFGESLQSPLNHSLAEALHELWDATVTLGRNLAESPKGPRLYVTPRVMSVSEIAVAVYGSSERASEILIANDFDDPFAIPAGTQVIWFVE